MTVDTNQLHRRWRLLSVSQVVVVVQFLAFVPILAIWEPEAQQEAMFMACYLPSLAVASLYVTFFDCPRCSKLFHYRWWGCATFPYRSKCLHCGLPRGCTDRSEIEALPKKEHETPVVL